MEAWRAAENKRGTEQNRAFIFFFIALVVRGAFKLDFWKYLGFYPNRLDPKFSQVQLVFTLSSFKVAVFGANNSGLPKTEEV